MKCLVEARCLSRAQAGRLFWPGRSESRLRTRLSELVKGEVLRKLSWYDRMGENVAYSLGPVGVRRAEALLEVELGAAREDISAAHLEHHLLLTELFVGLLAAPLEARLAKEGSKPKRAGAGGPHAAVSHPGFTWQVTGDIDMPWRQAVAGALESRVLRPDAVLVVPAHKRRLFIESETGTHSIATSNAQRFGATLNKMARYEAYCTTGPGNGGTWYASRYSDGYKPEVLFLVPTKARRDSVREAIAGWLKKHPMASVRFRAALVEEEVRALVPVVWTGVTPAGRSSFTISLEEAKALRAFYDVVLGEVKEKRDRARALNAAKPPYPPGTNAFAALLKRLQEESAG